MATSLGSTCGPLNSYRSCEVEPEDEPNGEDAWNPDKLVKCPYDPNHMIRQCRFPYHILKCKKNHPEMESELRTCPYNARHIVLKDELSKHMTVCVDQLRMEDVRGNQEELRKKYTVPISTITVPNSEDWDKEIEIGTTPFVWGVTSQLSPSPEVTNSLDTGLRPPRILPWK
ncbi:gametocyte-specific factor 1 [Engraulis encrasicolus]|uniref:gametocyte-specific factor 1 n=1 Tax=Engraulis encrasicolus TaxID=184585 RepID=UPI002FD34A89